ncbi:hypothetical protein ABWH97_13915 [Nitratireductor sp. ac15]
MSITNYGELKTAIANWLARSDLTDQIPDFVTLATSDLNRNLRVRQMEAVESLSPTSGVYTLPDDYLTFRSVALESNPRRTLELVSPEYMDRRYGDRASGFTQVFTVEGNTIRVAPTSSSNLELRYYAALGALSDDADTNWLLTKEPSIYLYTSLIHSAPFIGDDPRVSTWAEFAKSAVRSLTQEDTLAKIGRGGAHIRGATP